jgi:hypothetical protein
VESTNKTKKVEVEAPSQIFFKTLLSASSTRKNPDASPEGVEDTVWEESTNKTKKVEVEVDPHPKMEKGRGRGSRSKLILPTDFTGRFEELLVNLSRFAEIDQIS